MLRFELLGPVGVRSDGVGVPLGPPLRRTLLALLAWHRGSTVSVDRIVDALWEAEPPSRPEASIQAMMSHLRRAIEPDRGPRGHAEILRTQLPGYRLVLPAEAGLDVDDFRGALSAARAARSTGDHSSAAAAATHALQFWSGTPFAGAVDVAFVREATYRLEDERVAAQLIRAESAVALGRHDEVLGELEAMARAQPHDETVWRLLVLALYRSGRTADALSRHRTFVETQADELGLDPSPAFAELLERLLRQDPELAVPAVTPSASAVPDATAASDTPAAADSALEPAVQATTRVARPAGTILGRRRELSVVDEVVSAAIGGRAGIVLLTGPAGIGKSALAEELCRRAADAGVAVGVGRCHEDADVGALWPVQSALAELGAGPADAAASIVAALRERSGLRPLLLTVEDVHWAGAETLRLLGFLAVELAEAPVTLVLTSRPEQSPGLVGLLSTLARQPWFRRLELSELDAPDARALASRIAGNLSPGDLDLVVERAGGNPFFVGETTRLIAAGDRDGLPGGVRAVVQRRLQLLPEAARTVLRAAAVLGQRFDLELLSAVVEPQADDGIGTELLDALQQAIDLAILTEPAGSDGLVFSHAVVRDAVLDAAGPLSRRRWHLRAAQALKDSGDSLALAHHLVEGLPLTDRGAAIRAAVAAADAHLASRTYDTAAYWFGRALAILPGDDREPRLELLIQQAMALSHACALKELRICLIEAFDLAVALGRRAVYGELTEILDLSGGIWYWVDFGSVDEQLLDRLAAARAELGESGDPASLAARARLRGTEAVGLTYVDAERALRFGAEAVDLAERSGDAGALASALGQHGRVLWQAGVVDEQLRVAERLLDLVGQPRPGVDPQRWALAGLVGLAIRACGRSAYGRVDECAADIRRALELARRHRLAGAVSQLLWAEVGIATGRGDIAGARELAASAVQLTERTQLFQRESYSMVTASEIDRRLGRLAVWHPVILAIGDSVGLHTGWMGVEALLQGGQTNLARQRAETVADAVSGPHWTGWLACSCVQARVVADLADQVAAARILAALRPYSGRHAVWGSMLWLGPVDYYLGRLEVVVGNLPAARRLLRSALGQARAAGLVPIAADAAQALSEILPVGAESAAERRDLLSAAAAWQQELALAAV